MVNYTDFMLDKLPGFYKKDSTAMNYKFIKSLGNVLDVKKNNTNLLLLNGLIDKATGVYLERLGKLYNLRRNTGETDDSFRIRIKGFKTSNIGGGIDLSIINSINSSIGISKDNISITSNDDLTASFDISLIIGDTVLEDLNNLRAIVNTKKAAGTYFNKTNISSENDIFRINLSEINGEDLIL